MPRTGERGRTVGQVIAEQLAAAGVEWAFTVPGESFLGVLDALPGAGIKVVATRHEGGASFMAESRRHGGELPVTDGHRRNHSNGRGFGPARSYARLRPTTDTRPALVAPNKETPVSARILRAVLCVGLVATFLVAGATAALAAPPANDLFAARTVISGLMGQVNGTNVEATNETGEPDHAGVSGGQAFSASVWYDWTAPTSGGASFNACQNPAYDTVLAVYTGDDVGALTEVASNDDACSFQSVVGFAAVAGTSYKIAVDGFFGDQGTFTLTWRQCSIEGTSGNDNLVGTNDDDVICAGGGDDTISGRRGNDTILGEDGNDLAQPGGGNDHFDGGNGTDEINYNEAAPTAGATIHLGTQTASAPGAGSDTLVSVENATGSRFDDTITGSGGNNVISAREGNDRVNGKGGNDTIDGKAGNDTLGGENGNDTVIGGAGDDSLNGNAGADTVNGVDGVLANDTVNGGSDSDPDTCSADLADTVVNCP